MVSKSVLRRRLRRARAGLSGPAQRLAGRRAAQRLARTLRFKRARSVAVYIAADGELDPAPLAQLARREAKTCYLPVLHPFLPGRLLFGAWAEASALRPNRYGIPEPTSRCLVVWPRRLDLVVVPLLGFDARGNRLGMGGGYYDRSFAFRARCPGWRRPLLVGYAHACQQVERLPRAAWDIPLDWVVTDQSLMRFARGRRR